MLCPNCRKAELKPYEGNLGYESLTCSYCNLDIKSDEAISACNNYESQMRLEIRELKDKLSRRNMQIKDLKARLYKLSHKVVICNTCGAEFSIIDKIDFQDKPKDY